MTIDRLVGVVVAWCLVVGSAAGQDVCGVIQSSVTFDAPGAYVIEARTPDQAVPVGWIIYVNGAAIDVGHFEPDGTPCPSGEMSYKLPVSFAAEGAYVVRAVPYNGTASQPALAPDANTITVTISSSPQPPLVPVPSISASPASIQSGGSSTLTWNVSGTVDEASIAPGIGAVAPSGSRVVAPTSTTTYTFTAANVSGLASASVVVTVTPPPPSCTFSVTPSSLSVSSQAGTSTLTITSSVSTCAWTTAESVSWLSLSPISGTGSGSVAVTRSRNNSWKPRSGMIVVAGRSIIVTQARR